MEIPCECGIEPPGSISHGYRRLTWTGHEEGRSVLKIVTDIPAGKRPLGRPRRRWDDIIRMDLKEIGIDTRNWVVGSG